MKKVILAVGLLLATAQFSKAQKYAYIDSDYILANTPEYKSAQTQIDNLSIQWQKEVEAKYAEIDKLYKAFQAEEVLLTDEMKKKRENEIVAKEKEAKDLQKQHFGVDGDLFKKRQELVKPIQDKIYNAVKAIAEKGTYAVIFDKSSDLSMLYANPKYDKSDDVLDAMGLKKGYKAADAAKKPVKAPAPKPSTPATDKK
ncbi:MAG: OmpH family outer membrane protein [Bacteroidetes bacterium]|nr:OmpH family outer membrane protein [Bacteroidota bacterium]